MSPRIPTPLSADISAQLAGLHDIHLPDAISWWPLAPAWWALASLAVLALIATVLVRQHRRRSLKLAALRELTLLEKIHCDAGNVQALAAAVGVLLRRVVLSLPDGKQYANVHGQHWIDYLSAAPTGMSMSTAHLLAIAPYADPNAIPASEPTGSDSNQPVASTTIITEASTWIRRHA